MTPSKSIVHTLLSKWIFAIRTARQEGISTNLLIAGNSLVAAIREC